MKPPHRQPSQADAGLNTGVTYAGVPVNRLDFVRFALATLVIFSHSYPLATGSEAMEPFAVFTRHQMTFGVLAVDCFFIISGFLILHSWKQRPDARSFLWKRVGRIYPGFILAASLGSLWVVPMTSREGFTTLTPTYLLTFTANLLRLHDVPPGPAFAGNPAAGPINGSLWSIPFEFWCYIGILVLGLLKLADRRRLLLGLLLVSVATSFAFTWLDLRPGGKILGVIFGYPPFWARLLPYFFAGMVFYLYRESIPLRWPGAALAMVTICVAAKLPNGLIFALPFAAAYLLFWFAFHPGRFLLQFGRYGDFSYGIYLYSFPILQGIVWMNGAPMSPWTLFALAWPASVVVGAASWHGLEKHCVRAAARRGAPRQGARAARASA